MGVLEEAIREHLDLKRKHGASDAELNRQAAEALGPARREAPESEVAEVSPDHDEPVEAPAGEAPVEEQPVEPAAVEGQDTVIYAPGEVPVPPAEGDDPDFGGEAPEQKPPRDFDFD